MIAAAVAGAGVGLGLLMLHRALWPPVPSLAEQLAALDAGPPPAPPWRPGAGWSGLRAGVGDRLAAVWAARGWLSARLRADLAVTGRDAGDFLAGKVLAGGIGGLVLPVCVGPLTAAGVQVPVLIPVWAALTCALVGFLLPDLQLRSAAAAARRDIRAGVGSYLDLTAMRMASGAGLGEALGDAAQVGAGPAFARIRGSLADARTDGVTPATALGRLGTEIGVADLVDAAARLSLVDTSGAQAQASLQAHAASLRDRELAEVQGRANERSQSMLVAQVVLGLGFLIFLAYPGLAKVLAM